MIDLNVFSLINKDRFEKFHYALKDNLQKIHNDIILNDSVLDNIVIRPCALVLSSIDALTNLVRKLNQAQDINQLTTTEIEIISSLFFIGEQNGKPSRGIIEIYTEKQSLVDIEILKNINFVSSDGIIFKVEKLKDKVELNDSDIYYCYAISSDHSSYANIEEKTILYPVPPDNVIKFAQAQSDFTGGKSKKTPTDILKFFIEAKKSENVNCKVAYDLMVNDIPLYLVSSPDQGKTLVFSAFHDANDSVIKNNVLFKENNNFVYRGQPFFGQVLMYDKNKLVDGYRYEIVDETENGFSSNSVNCITDNSCFDCIKISGIKHRSLRAIETILETHRAFSINSVKLVSAIPVLLEFKIFINSTEDKFDYLKDKLTNYVKKNSFKNRIDIEEITSLDDSIKNLEYKVTRFFKKRVNNETYIIEKEKTEELILPDAFHCWVTDFNHIDIKRVASNDN